MKYMNSRQKKILYLLLSEPDDYLVVQDFADRVRCSEKTIRNDLKTIEDFLNEHAQAQLIRKPGLGVYLHISEQERSRLSRQIYNEHFTCRHKTDEERILHIAYDLLMNSKPVSAKEIAAQHFVNRASIKKDVSAVEEWLKRFDLILVSKQRLGLKIEGDEKNKRKALARISDLIDNAEFTSQFIKSKFLSYEADFVRKEIKLLQKNHSIYFTDETFESLLLHTLLTIRRIKMKQPVAISARQLDAVKKKKEYEWTLACLKRLEPVFAIRFPEEEAVYLTLHIIGGKVRYPSQLEKKLDLEDSELSKVVRHLINRVSELQMLDFYKDQELINGLNIHLDPVLKRLSYDLSVSNPMLHDIKKMYPYLFHLIIDVLEDINQTFDLYIPEEEAAYLTLHFQAAIERLRRNSHNPKRTIIVCHMGIGMSQLLRTKIERKFHYITVKDCIAKAELTEYIKKHKDIDFVISTIGLGNVTIPHIVVSPLLESADEKKLSAFLQQLDISHRREQKTFKMLNDTTPFLVFLQQETEHRYQVIEKLAQALYEKGYVEKEYGIHAVMREKMSATNIGAGIAIPHANSKYIKQSAIAIATLKEPIEWGTEKVSVVFMLAVKHEDQNKVKQLFSELSYLSEQPAFIQKLTEEKNVMMFLSYLNY
ncbi:BglG family transcription antiterminator [Bacillus velezensis]|uniref:BglG family transcription antiterminator n=1 Tax=Bacillus velezensis (strain DSM 23117 / BGSC 10A6 / LMG 26770 / FZB42) TaxID=326423 RepID=A7Z705_BACVZ|nr:MULTISPECIES: BglG family transcription antiterminator [Bacillus amyloliquefaciens group]ABS74781.1 BglG family transcription antiterminator [Bacillus velezensis FZB42]MBG9698979.1 PTS sugar transporter subunit IIA [Bacillus amyloliquefaciens]MBT9270939.1 BglG family transcription antiterminator [Bacillus velezensis]MCF7603298.1 BglG family transcription antiterminator [Bacillus velezensis]MDF0745076.1 BglG family transcription antiterminator [Bacillus velezensis]